eukprot:1145417-Pelagomonas_calceolata.AAC.3
MPGICGVHVAATGSKAAVMIKASPQPLVLLARLQIWWASPPCQRKSRQRRLVEKHRVQKVGCDPHCRTLRMLQ